MPFAFQRLAQLINFVVNLLHTLLSPPRGTIFPRRRPPERPDPSLEVIALVSVQGSHFIGDREEVELFEIFPHMSEELLCAVESAVLAFHDVPDRHLAVERVEEDEAAIV
jgi:hypothetical protein